MDELIDAPDRVDAPLIKWYPFLVWGILFVISYLFRVMHWPGASTLHLVSIAAIVAYCILGLIYKQRQGYLYVFTWLSGLWFLIIHWGAFFNGGYPFNFVGIRRLYVAMIVLGLIQFLFVSLRKRRISRMNATNG